MSTAGANITKKFVKQKDYNKIGALSSKSASKTVAAAGGRGKTNMGSHEEMERLIKSDKKKREKGSPEVNGATAAEVPRRNRKMVSDEVETDWATTNSSEKTAASLGNNSTCDFVNRNVAQEKVITENRETIRDERLLKSSPRSQNHTSLGNNSRQCSRNDEQSVASSEGRHKVEKKHSTTEDNLLEKCSRVSDRPNEQQQYTESMGKDLDKNNSINFGVHGGMQNSGESVKETAASPASVGPKTIKNHPQNQDEDTNSKNSKIDHLITDSRPEKKSTASSKENEVDNGNESATKSGANPLVNDVSSRKNESNVEKFPTEQLVAESLRLDQENVDSEILKRKTPPQEQRSQLKRKRSSEETSSKDQLQQQQRKGNDFLKSDKNGSLKLPSGTSKQGKGAAACRSPPPQKQLETEPKCYAYSDEGTVIEGSIAHVILKRLNVTDNFHIIQDPLERKSTSSNEFKSKPLPFAGSMKRPRINVSSTVASQIRFGDKLTIQGRQSSGDSSGQNRYEQAKSVSSLNAGLKPSEEQDKPPPSENHLDVESLFFGMVKREINLNAPESVELSNNRKVGTRPNLTSYKGIRRPIEEAHGNSLVNESVEKDAGRRPASNGKSRSDSATASENDN